MPDILFRMPIKDNVTCKICKLLPNQRRPGPTPHSHLHSPALRPSQLPWRSHGAQAVRPLGTLGLREMASPKPPRSAEVGGDSEGPFCPLLLCTPFAPGPWVSPHLRSSASTVKALLSQGWKHRPPRRAHRPPARLGLPAPPAQSRGGLLEVSAPAARTLAST